MEQPSKEWVKHESNRFIGVTEDPVGTLLANSTTVKPAVGLNAPVFNGSSWSEHVTRQASAETASLEITDCLAPTELMAIKAIASSDPAVEIFLGLVTSGQSVLLTDPLIVSAIKTLVSSGIAGMKDVAIL